MNVVFIASVSIITPNPAESRKLFVDTLGLPLAPDATGAYYFSEHIGGAKHFGVWPLAQAAQACFGVTVWPSNTPIPQLSIEFEVADADSVGRAAEELTAQGYPLVHPVRTEPWGQTVTRFLTPEGVIVGISYAPWLHENEAV